MSTLRGTAVSPGIAVGRALIVERDVVPVFRLSLPQEQIEQEVIRLEAALEGSREQLRSIKERLSREVGRAPRLHLRRAPADARRPDAAEPGRGDRARRST